MEEAQRTLLCAQIRAQPARFVGQERIGLSTMPCLNESGSLEARHGTLRAFTCQCPSGFLVLPGGLTRVANRPDTRLVSNQEGGVSKDTWVLRSPSVVRVADEAAAEPEPGLSEPDGLPRRVADNLLWAGRYAERAEGLIRWMRLILRRLQMTRFESRAGADVTTQMLRALTHLSGSYPGFVGEDGLGRNLKNPEPELLRLLTDVRVPGSIPSALNALQNTANALRDRLSAESVRVLTGLREIGQPLGALRDPFVAEGLLGDLTVHLLALSGLTHESMLRHHGWRFIDCGRRLERGLLLIGLLRSTQVLPPQETRQAVLLNDMVLAFAESLSVFRSRPACKRDAQGLLDLLLLEPENPRALIYQIDRLLEHVALLPRLERDERLPEYARHLELARSRLRLAAAGEWVGTEGVLRTGLDELLAEEQRELSAAYEALFRHFLAPAPTLPLVGRVRP